MILKRGISIESGFNIAENSELFYYCFEGILVPDWIRQMIYLNGVFLKYDWSSLRLCDYLNVGGLLVVKIYPYILKLHLKASLQRVSMFPGHNN